MRTVGDRDDRRISAGTIVQPISSGVLPWICLGFSFLPLAVAVAERDTTSAPARTNTPTATEIKKTGMKRLSIVSAAGPSGFSEFWPLSGSRARREDDDGGRATTGRGRPPLRARRQVPHPPLPITRSPSCPAGSRGTLYRRASAPEQPANLVTRAFASQYPSRSSDVGAALPVALHPDPGLEVDPDAEERLELVAGRGAGLLQHPAALPMTMPFCDSRSTRIDRPERRIRPSSARRRRPSSSSISSAATR